MSDERILEMALRAGLLAHASGSGANEEFLCKLTAFAKEVIASASDLGWISVSILPHESGMGQVSYRDGHVTEAVYHHGRDIWFSESRGQEKPIGWMPLSIPMAASFINLCLAGVEKPEDIDTFIASCKADPGNETPLHERLGMSLDEYTSWSLDPSILQDMLLLRKAAMV